MVFCAEPGCGALVPRGRCPEHELAANRARPGPREKGYNARWDRRARAFRNKFPLCGMRPGGLRPVMSRCYDEKRVTLAYQVDHVVPHRGNPDLFWDELGNWQSLCAACGSRKTAAGL